VPAFGGLVAPSGQSDRLILARSVGRRLIRRLGDRVLATGAVGPTVRTAAAVAPLRIVAVARDGGVHRHAFVADGTPVQVVLGGVEALGDAAGSMDLDWPLEGPLFADPVVMLDGDGVLARLARAEAENEARRWPDALAQALAGPVAAAGLDVWAADRSGDAARAAAALPAFVWSAVRLVALGNRHAFVDPADWIAETAGLRTLPAGFADLAAAAAGPPAAAVAPALGLFDALPAWAARLGAPVPSDLPG
jgi:hypothetical protein